MLKPEIAELLNKQVNAEFYASNVYLQLSGRKMRDWKVPPNSSAVIVWKNARIWIRFLTLCANAICRSPSDKSMLRQTTTQT